MDNYVAPEIPGYVETIIRKAFGANETVKSVEWSAGGLFNKVYYVNTSTGSYILKIECDKIIPSSRKGQIENEVESIRLLSDADISCPALIAHDFTGSDIGKKYLLTERVSGDILWIEHENMDDNVKAEVEKQTQIIFEQMKAISSPFFGSLTSSGPLGQHKNWNDCYHAWFDLLIKDSEDIGLFTGEELSVVKIIAGRPLPADPSSTLTPIYEHGDFGWHNLIWGHIHNESDKLYVIDFGNVKFLPPHLTVFGCNPFEVPNAQELDKGINLLLLYDFEMGVMWKEMQKITEDYAHCITWMEESIKSAKKDTSRNHITDFAEKCRKLI